MLDLHWVRGILESLYIRIWVNIPRTTFRKSMRSVFIDFDMSIIDMPIIDLDVYI